jgi:hypothetical protein
MIVVVTVFGFVLIGLFLRWMYAHTYNQVQLIKAIMKLVEVVGYKNDPNQ